MTLWRDPSGTTHKVRVVETRDKTSIIEYIENARRGITYRVGRKYNHGTRVRICVYNHELMEVSE